MKIIINHSSMQPIYEQITDQIKAMIIDGTLKEEEMLPSVRVRGYGAWERQLYCQE